MMSIASRCSGSSLPRFAAIDRSVATARPPDSTIHIDSALSPKRLWAIERVDEGWTLRKRATASTASLLWYGAPPARPGDSEKIATVFDRVRKGLTTEKAALSKAVADNHGISIRHLQSLFYPLAINVPDDPLLTPSLEMLIAIRHEWAHRYRHGATVVKSASDVKKTVRDCLLFARKLSAAASAARP